MCAFALETCHDARQARVHGERQQDRGDGDGELVPVQHLSGTSRRTLACRERVGRGETGVRMGTPVIASLFLVCYDQFMLRVQWRACQPVGSAGPVSTREPPHLVTLSMLLRSSQYGLRTGSVSFMSVSISCVQSTTIEHESDPLLHQPGTPHVCVTKRTLVASATASVVPSTASSSTSRPAAKMQSGVLASVASSE